MIPTPSRHGPASPTTTSTRAQFHSRRDRGKVRCVALGIAAGAPGDELQCKTRVLRGGHESNRCVSHQRRSRYLTGAATQVPNPNPHQQTVVTMHRTIRRTKPRRLSSQTLAELSIAENAPQRRGPTKRCFTRPSAKSRLGIHCSRKKPRVPAAGEWRQPGEGPLSVRNQEEERRLIASPKLSTLTTRRTSTKTYITGLARPGDELNLSN